MASVPAGKDRPALLVKFGSGGGRKGFREISLQSSRDHSICLDAILRLLEASLPATMLPANRKTADTGKLKRRRSS